MPSYEVTSMSKPQLPPDATYGERQEYRRDVLLLPGPVDRWLTTNIRTPHINFLKDYLLLADLQTEYVTCSVELVCTKPPADDSPDLDKPTIYTLYITADPSPKALTYLFIRRSPKVILERYTGFNEALDAPDWSKWTEPKVKFQQPKASFANLFLRMATWDENKKVPGLPYRMAQWCDSLMISTAGKAKSYVPVTPHRQIIKREDLRSTSPRRSDPDLSPCRKRASKRARITTSSPQS